MYRYSNGQIRLSDFKQPMGMNLKEDNRWVKRALLIPWNDIEKRYASLFTNRKGNVAKPLRLDTIHKVYEQQKIMYDTHTHHVSDRIVSLS